tara:strand:+ start:337 stop:1143 length:807 start_codon:yes stop_codon:yes gene_type:complete
MVQIATKPTYDMKKLILLLFIPLVSFGQTAIYYSDDVLSIEIPTNIDVLLGYPTANELESEAIDSYNQGTELFYSLNEISENEEKIKTIKKAINYFVAAINSDPKFVQAYDNLGKAFRMIEEYDLAIKSYKASLEILPTGNAAIQNLAIVYVYKKNWNEAAKQWQELIYLMPQNPEGYYGLANVYLNISELDLALSNALTALRLYEQNPTNYIGDGYGQVGLVYYYMGNKSMAKKYIQTAKNKYIENGLYDYFYSTFTRSLLKELSIE